MNIRPKKPGRPTKAEKNPIVTSVLGTTDASKLLAEFSGDRALPIEALLKASVTDRLKLIDEMIWERREALDRSIPTDPKAAFAKEAPWMTVDSAEEQMTLLSQKKHLNDRVMGHLTEQLWTHAVLARRIENELAQARQAYLAKALGVPKGLQEFIVNLHINGLKAASVKDLSKSAIDAIVALLNRELSEEDLERVGLGRSRRFVSEEEAEAAVEEARRLMEAAGAPETYGEDFDGPEIIEPVVPDGFDQPWDYANGPIPPEYWSTIQETSLPYKWEYRMARPEEEEQVLGMPLPDAHEWQALRSWDMNFAEIALDRIRTKRGAVNNVRDIVSARRGIEPDDVDMNLVKTWLFLLSARFMKAKECDELWEPDFFEGLVMACPATGVGIVRELVKKGM